jgi:hypothetical protein
VPIITVLVQDGVDDDRSALRFAEPLATVRLSGCTQIFKLTRKRPRESYRHRYEVETLEKLSIFSKAAPEAMASFQAFDEAALRDGAIPKTRSRSRGNIHLNTGCVEWANTAVAVFRPSRADESFLSITCCSEPHYTYIIATITIPRQTPSVTGRLLGSGKAGQTQAAHPFSCVESRIPL